MSEPNITQLLDRAVQHAPAMHLSGEALLAAGQGRVRRRRTVGVGSALGAAALVAAVWAGLSGGEGSLTGLPEVQPATTVFERGEAVDAMLFDGFQTIDSDQAAHSFDARLTQGTTGPLVLEVSDGGDVAERITAQSPVPGLEVFAGETMTVALWREPEGVVTSVPLVGPVDPGGPSGREQVEIDGEQFGYAVYAEGVQGVQVPDSVRDVYLVGRDDVVALSGADIESEVLEVGDARALVWFDASTGVWGHSVDEQEASIDQLGDRPAQFASYSSVLDGVETSVTVLPAGEVDEVGLAVSGSVRDSDYRGAVLGDRTVVLATGIVGEDPAGRVVPTFRLEGGPDYTLDTYAEDLLTLDTVGGEPLSAQPEPDGSLLLRDQAGAEVLSIAAEHLTPAPTSWETELGTVVAAVGWSPDASILQDARVELPGDGLGAEPEWVEPTDVAQVVTPTGEVTLMILDAPAGASLVSVGLVRGEEVERWAPPVIAAGVEWRQVDGVESPFVDGEPVPRVDDGTSDAIRHYAVGEGSASGYVVLPGTAVDATFVPLVLDDQGLRAATDIVHQVDQVEVAGAQHTVLSVVGGLGSDGASGIVGVAAHRPGPEDSVNTWQVVGDAGSAHVVVDPGAVVSVAAESGLWLLYPSGSTDPDELEVGRVGGDLLYLSTDGARGPALTIVAVHPEDTPAPRVGTADGQQEPTQTVGVDELGLTVSVWTEQVPTG